MSDPHAPSQERAYLSVLDAATQFTNASLTSRDWVVTLLERVAALDAMTGLNAMAGLAPDAVLVAHERDVERGSGVARGPLHGVPVLIKDNIEARDLPSLAGASALHGRPSGDAELVTRLREAGAIVMGSTNLSQWANMRSTRSTSGYSATGGLVGNPWSLGHSAGGSSSGSGAAVAAGFAPLAVGTETDGSIICPASFNGLVGLKPTVGRVSRDGVVPISSRQDSPGPMARTVADAALLYEVLSGDARPPVIDHPRLVEATSWRTGHPASDALFEEVMAQARQQGVAVAQRAFAIPTPELWESEFFLLLCEFRDDLTAYLSGRPGAGVHSMQEVMDYENAHAELEHRYFGHELFSAAMATQGRTSADYAPRLDALTTWVRDECLEPGLGSDDVIVSPAYGPAWKSDLVKGDSDSGASPPVSMAAIMGWPIATVPMGCIDGLPVGLSLVGRPHQEWSLLAAATTFETVVRRRAWECRPTWRR